MFSLRWPSWSWLGKVLPAIVALCGVAALYLWHLGKLTTGLSPAEATARAGSRSFHTIWNNPINAPSRLIQYGLQSTGHHGAFWLRLSSVFFVLLLLGLFYLLARGWFGRMVGFLAAVMLATTPWVILLARNATADILLLAPIALWTAYGWLKRVKPKWRNWAWLAMVVAAALSLYVSGLFWLVLVGGVVTRKRLAVLPKELGKAYFYGYLALGVLILVPLLISIASKPSLAEPLLLWPSHWQPLVATLKAIVWSALALVWMAPYHIPMIMGRLAVLDATQIVLAFFGIFALWSRARRELYALSALAALGIIGAGIDHNLLLITLALPALAIMVAAGLRFLYVEWRSVFPLNPLPRTLAIAILVVLVALHVLLGVRYTLVAWPHTVATRQTYVIK